MLPGLTDSTGREVLVGDGGGGDVGDGGRVGEGGGIDVGDGDKVSDGDCDGVGVGVLPEDSVRVTGIVASPPFE